VLNYGHCGTPLNHKYLIGTPVANLIQKTPTYNYKFRTGRPKWITDTI
jgi:hypothetical protein